MSTLIDELTQYYAGQVARYRNRCFLRAVMAACALVCAAGGAVSLLQRTRVDQVLEALEALKAFDPHEGVALFDDFAELLARDPAEGHRQVLEAVTREVAAKPEEAGLLVRICMAVAGCDPGASTAERREILGLCRHLGVDPGDCGMGSPSAHARKS